MQEKNQSLGVKISLDPLSIKNNVLCIPAYMVKSVPRLVREIS
jgi:hypothetical protein